MAVTGDLSPDYANKTALLAAVAEAGMAGKQAYLDAQAKIAASQQAQVQAALASSAGPMTGEQSGAVAGVIGAGGGAARGRTAGIGGFLSGVTDLADKEAFAKYLDVNEQTVLPAMLAEAAGSGGSGGGGGGGRGGGGGGRGGSDDEDNPDWYTPLRKDAGGLKSFIPDYLAGASRGYGDPGLPRDLRARQFAGDVYGVPESALDQISPVRGYLKDQLQSLASAKANKVSYKRFSKDIRKIARETPGNQVKGRKYVETFAKKALKPKSGRR